MKKKSLTSKTTLSLISFFLKISYLAVLGLFALDLFFYSGFVSNHLIHPIIIAIVFFGIHLLIRRIWHQRLSDDFIRLNWHILAPASLLLGLTAYYLEEYGLLFPNYFFSNFKLHYLALPYFAFPALGFGAVHITKTFWQSNWKHFVFMLSIILITSAGFLFYCDKKLYSVLTAEDGIIEYLTAVGFAIAGILALLLIKNRNFFSHSLTRKIFVTGCIMAGLSLIIVAGEEISWGQRIFNIETPESIAAINRQGEINLHNSEMLWPYVYSTYSFIGLYGMGMWILEWMTRDIFPFNKELFIWKKILVPGGHLFVMFGLIYCYVWLRMKFGPWKYQAWEEFSELLLASGILIHLIEVYTTAFRTDRD